MNLSEVVAGVVAREAGANPAVEVRIPAPLMVMAETELLGRALGNLLRNALPVRGDRGASRSEARAEGPVAVVIVGPGPAFPRSRWRGSANPFFRPDPARPGKRGTGLGLAIVRTCVDACRGRWCSGIGNRKDSKRNSGSPRPARRSFRSFRRSPFGFKTRSDPETWECSGATAPSETDGHRDSTRRFQPGFPNPGQLSAPSAGTSDRAPSNTVTREGPEIIQEIPNPLIGIDEDEPRAGSLRQRSELGRKGGKDTGKRAVHDPAFRQVEAELADALSIQPLDQRLKIARPLHGGPPGDAEIRRRRFNQHHNPGARRRHDE